MIWWRFAFEIDEFGVKWFLLRRRFGKRVNKKGGNVRG